MNKFDVRLTFPLIARDYPQVSKTIYSLPTITRLHGRRSASGLLSLAIVSQFPMAVEVDGERWNTVDRVSVDAALLIVNLNNAGLPNEILEKLALYDERVKAAQWAVTHNDWFTEMKRF